MAYARYGVGLLGPLKAIDILQASSLELFDRAAAVRLHQEVAITEEGRVVRNRRARERYHAKRFKAAI